MSEQQQQVVIEEQFPAGYVRPLHRGVTFTRADRSHVDLEELVEDSVRAAHGSRGVSGLGQHFGPVSIRIVIEPERRA
jgi:hypothetical protein